MGMEASVVVGWSDEGQEGGKSEENRAGLEGAYPGGTHDQSEKTSPETGKSAVYWVCIIYQPLIAHKTTVKIPAGCKSISVSLAFLTKNRFKYIIKFSSSVLC